MNTPTSRTCVVLLSGGLDSATTLAIARRDGFAPVCLAFDYGQRHRCELEAAARVAEAQACRLRVVKLDASCFRGSALTGGGDVPRDRTEAQMGGPIPETYVPARNLVFLSMALGTAESIGSRDLFIGVNAVDYSGYPDCRPEFISAFEETANLATRAGVEGDSFRVHTPLLHLSKARIIRSGHELGVDYALTSSCYDPDEQGRACARCDSCQLRRRCFEEAGLPDPTRYAPGALA
ncbi:MAG: 7-cyano-7-deazaguanine synthase QueC [Phycisphaerales bacterium JB059]